MDKDDYKDKFEEHRQTIGGEEEEAPQKMSRTERYRGDKNEKPEKKKRHLMEYLSITFILILISILIFVWLFYEPGDKVAKVADSDEVEVVKDGEPATKDKDATDKEDDKEKAEKAALAKKKAEEAKKAEEERQARAEQQQEQHKAEEAKKAEEARQAEANRQAEVARQAEAAKKAQQQQQQRQQQKPQQPQASTHTVQAGETLYRIGVNYYGSGDEATLQKIRAANGLSSNNIVVGQQITLP